ncbi:hypothetical protein AMTR_s00075p00162500 [Amborella trichopoda]|uniref:Uncharacterized protein n=1 Tax=Amborella trichopoda TaxID=13333 RepID=W1PA94_AMBTC|nr:hypothetical protein AMTR_s00075p00162500 [Amborella trichopoda]
MAAWAGSSSMVSLGNPSHGGPLPMDGKPPKPSGLAGGVGGEESGKGSFLVIDGSVSRAETGSSNGVRSGYCMIAGSSYGIRGGSTTVSSGDLGHAIIGNMSDSLSGAYGGKDAKGSNLHDDPAMGSLKAAPLALDWRMFMFNRRCADQGVRRAADITCNRSVVDIGSAPHNGMDVTHDSGSLVINDSGASGFEQRDQTKDTSDGSVMDLNMSVYGVSVADIIPRSAIDDSKKSVDVDNGVHNNIIAHITNGADNDDGNLIKKDVDNGAVLGGSRDARASDEDAHLLDIQQADGHHDSIIGEPSADADTTMQEHLVDVAATAQEKPDASSYHDEGLYDLETENVNVADVPKQLEALPDGDAAAAGREHMEESNAHAKVQSGADKSTILLPLISLLWRNLMMVLPAKSRWVSRMINSTY